MLWHDHLLAFALIVILPILGAIEIPKLKAALAAGNREALRREYIWTILQQWTLVGVVAAIWIFRERRVDELWLVVPREWPTYAAAGVTLVLSLAIAQQPGAIRRLVAKGDQDKIARVRKSLGEAEALIPIDDREHSLFNAVAVTAGVCEEVLYRGFLTLYFSTLIMDGLGERVTLGQSRWLAMLVASAAFGFAHVYQGKANIVRTGIIGLLAGVLTLLSGSLLWPMVLHAVIDLAGGASGRALVTAGKSGAERPGAPAA